MILNPGPAALSRKQLSVLPRFVGKTHRRESLSAIHQASLEAFIAFSELATLAHPFPDSTLRVLCLRSIC